MSVQQISEQAEVHPQMLELLNALKRYETYCDPGDLPSVELFSDGSGRIATSQSGFIHHFHRIPEAIKFLSVK